MFIWRNCCYELTYQLFIHGLPLVQIDANWRTDKREWALPMSLFQAKITGTGNRPLGSWISTFTTKPAIPVRSEKHCTEYIISVPTNVFLEPANEAPKALGAGKLTPSSRHWWHSNDHNGLVDWSLMVVYGEWRTSGVQVRIRELNLI